MKAILLVLLPHLIMGQETAPTARPMAVTISDTDLLRPASTAVRRNMMAFHRKRKRANTVEEEDEKAIDDYRDFEDEGIKNRDPGELKTVTYSPITTPYDIPKLSDSSEVSTLSPEPGKVGKASKGFKVTKDTQLYTWYRPEALRRKGYYFMHYPWNMLPKPYRLQPSYQFIYPVQYQNTVYSYPALPYNSDPYGVYKHLVPCGSPGGYCGNQGGGCGGGGCGGGCGSGGAGGCGDTEGYSGDESEEETDEDSEDGGKSGEAHINKQDPLDDLDLEDLEKLDKDKDVEEEETTEKETEERKKRRKTSKH